MCRYIVLFIALFAPLCLNAGQNTLQTSEKEFAALEKASGGRLGVYSIDTENNRTVEYRGNERFPLCSTMKVMAVATILKKSEHDSTLLNKRVQYSKKDLVTYSPMTKKHITDGMTIAALSKATITTSDNAAVNLLIKQLGGFSKVNAFARRIGNKTFNLKHFEPNLNAVPGNDHDTSTPKEMAVSLQKLILSDVLGVKQRRLLTDWLIQNKVGKHRIKAGVPKSWVVADKTGTCGHGTTNDIAVIWPMNKAPIIIAIYFTQSKAPLHARENVIAKVARELSGISGQLELKDYFSIR